MPLLSGGAKVGQPKPLQRHDFQAASQTFRGLPEQIGRGAAQDEKASRQWRAVSQHAQQGKELGAALDLINDDQSFQGAQSGVRFA